MIAKSLFTGGVLAALVGSVVYFGTDGVAQDGVKDEVKARVESGALDAKTAIEDAGSSAKSRIDSLLNRKTDHPHGETSKPDASKPDASKEDASKEDAPKTPKTTTTTTTTTTIVTKSKPIGAGAPEIIETDVVETDVVETDVVETDSDADTKAPKSSAKWIDSYLKKNRKSDKAEVESVPVEVELFDDEDMVEDVSEELVEADEDEIVEEVEEVVEEMPAPKAKATREDSLKILTEAASAAFTVRDGSNPDTVFDLMMDEAEKLDIVDMGDQAYLHIVDYALAEGDTARARMALDKLSSEELRDTARTRMGVAYAKSGKMDAAFAVLDELEIEALSDPIRLEIIRAVSEASAE